MCKNQFFPRLELGLFDVSQIKSVEFIFSDIIDSILHAACMITYIIYDKLYIWWKDLYIFCMLFI